MNMNDLNAGEMINTASDYATSAFSSLQNSNMDVGEIAQNIAGNLNDVSGLVVNLIHFLSLYLVASGLLSIRNKYQNGTGGYLHSLIPMGVGALINSPAFNLANGLGSLLPHTGMLG